MTTVPASAGSSGIGTPDGPASIFLSVQVGSSSAGSVTVSATATLTRGPDPYAGQAVSFVVGGGCSPAFSDATTAADGLATIQVSCPVGAGPVSMTVSGGGTQASTSFVPS